MSTESYLWDKLDKAFSDLDNIHFSRHEDKSRPGIPDVSYGMYGVNGWIELKACNKWPANPETLVKPKHELTKPQKRFQKRRGQSGGHVFVMLIVNRGRDMEVLLFDWRVSEAVGESTRDELEQLACYHSRGGIGVEDLIQALT